MIAGFKSFLLTLCAVSIIAGIITSASPDGTLKHGIKYVVAAAAVAVILLPLPGIFGEIESFTIPFEETKVVNFNDYDPLYRIYIESKDMITKEVEEMIVKKYKFNDSDVRVEIITDSEDYSNIEITCIRILLPNNEKALFADLIKKHIEEQFLSPVVIEFV